MAPCMASSGNVKNIWCRLNARSSAAIAASEIDSRSLICDFFLSILVDQNCFRQSGGERRHDDIEDEKNTCPEPFIAGNRVVGDQAVCDFDGADQQGNQERVDDDGKHQFPQTQVYRQSPEYRTDDGNAPGCQDENPGEFGGV